MCNVPDAPSSSRPDLLVLGLGNPILSDDRVGLEVARLLVARLPPGAARLEEASVGGIELLHVLEGWRQVVIVDASEPGFLSPGDVQELPLADLASRVLPTNPHNAGLLTCLALGRAVGMAMPETVRVFAIGVSDPYTFAERCTPEVARAIPQIVDFIAKRLRAPAT